MNVNKWMSHKCSDEGTFSQIIRNSSTHSHASEEENRTRNRSKNCKCKRALRHNHFDLQDKTLPITLAQQSLTSQKNFVALKSD